MKKAQTTISQVFIYILGVIVIAVLLIFGYNAIKTVLNKADKVETAQFEKELTNSLDSISQEYGDVKIENFNVPSAYKEVCFVNNYPELPSTLTTSNLLIKRYVESKEKENIFLVGDDETKPIEAGKISISSGLLCIPVMNGDISIRLEGMGNHVKISKS